MCVFTFREWCVSYDQLEQTLYVASNPMQEIYIKCMYEHVCTKLLKSASQCVIMYIYVHTEC